MTRHVPALVVGGGISGLVCAYSLRKAGIDAQLVEASARTGGVIQSILHEGFLLELGPQSFSSTASLQGICHELAIENQIVEAPRSPRFVLIDGALRPVPLSPPAFFTSSFVGMKTKLAILRDVFGQSAPPAVEESVGAFIRRKFTPELLEKLVGPFVSGIYAGDPEKLSLSAAFPQLHEAETKARSIVRGLIRLAKQGKQAGAPRRNIFSFRDGNETLVRALSSKLGPAMQTGVKVTGLARRDDSAFDVQLDSNGQNESILTKAVVIATPTEVAGKLLAGLDAAFEALLEPIEYASVSVVSLGYLKKDIGHSLDGFGFLVPRSAGFRILGTVWNSSLFPARATDGHVLLTSFVGGTTDPAAAALSPAALVDLAHTELKPLLSISGDPVFSNVTSWPHALPQYNLGHNDRLAAITKLLRSYSGIWLSGNYLRGPAVGSCMEHALAVAEDVRRVIKS